MGNKNLLDGYRTLDLDTFGDFPFNELVQSYGLEEAGTRAESPYFRGSGFTRWLVDLRLKSR